MLTVICASCFYREERNELGHAQCPRCANPSIVSVDVVRELSDDIPEHPLPLDDVEPRSLPAKETRQEALQVAPFVVPAVTSVTRQQTFIETPEPEDILRSAVAAYEPRIVVAAVSGGRDSIAAAHIASQHPRFAGVLHLNTGIGIEETRQFVRDVCQDRGWRLWEYRAVDNCRTDGTPDPMVYERLCIEHGFPGPDHHRKMYNRLKQRPLAMFLRHMKERRGDKILLVNGMRRQESQRRMGTSTIMQRDAKTGCYWSSPLYYFDKAQRDDYTAAYDLPVNPVSERLCMSGECKCGAYATIGERDVDRFFYPNFAADLDRIEEAVQAARDDYNVWGWAATPEYARRWARQRVPDGQTDFLPLCVGCDNRMAMQAEIIGEQDGTPR